MLAIYLTDDQIGYAQLVNYQGKPFIESSGCVDLKQGISPSDAGNPELRGHLGETIASIRNNTEFPDSKTYVIIDSSWFPLQFHAVDTVLTDKDLIRYLGWRSQEMLDQAVEQFDLIHQPLAAPILGGMRQYMSLARPQGIPAWIDRILEASELEVERIVLDLEAVGALLGYMGKLQQDQQVLVLENRKDMLRARVYAHQDIQMVFDLGLSWDYHVLPERVRGDRAYVDRVVHSLRNVFRDPGAELEDIGKVLVYTSDGDPGMISNLLQHPAVDLLDPTDHFQFRDPELKSAQPYVIPLGILALEIQERFHAD